MGAHCSVKCGAARLWGENAAADGSAARGSLASCAAPAEPCPISVVLLRAPA